MRKLNYICRRCGYFQNPPTYKRFCKDCLKYNLEDCQYHELDNAFTGGNQLVKVRFKAKRL